MSSSIFEHSFWNRASDGQFRFPLAEALKVFSLQTLVMGALIRLTS